MYKYYSCLETPADFETSYRNSESEEHIPIGYASIKNLDKSIIEEMRLLFIDFKIIDWYMIEFEHIHFSYDIDWAIAELSQVRGDEDVILKRLMSEINITNVDLLEILLIYRKYTWLLSKIYLDKKDFFIGVLKRIKKLIKYAEGLNYFIISATPSFTDKWPNNW